jgi:hypothetical protein
VLEPAIANKGSGTQTLGSREMSYLLQIGIKFLSSSTYMFTKEKVQPTREQIEPLARSPHNGF